MLSKGPPDLSPENFRLTAQFSEPRLRIPFCCTIKKTSTISACFFNGGDGGILLLLSKGTLYLSPKNFRLTAQFLEPRIRIPFCCMIKKTSTKSACLFNGGDGGILLLLSKGPPDLSPENFRLTAQFSEPRLRIPFCCTIKKTSTKSACFFNGGDGGIRTHVPQGAS